ncbi:hypothetical protein WI97_14900 [Burkholderia vietnamiensis]|nr:hypothetical protein WI97_14900 [Burkholderia vietnamiensis]
MAGEARARSLQVERKNSGLRRKGGGRFDTDAVRDRSGVERRSQFVEDLAAPFYGFRRGGARLP